MIKTLARSVREYKLPALLSRPGAMPHALQTARKHLARLRKTIAIALGLYAQHSIHIRRAQRTQLNWHQL